MGTKLSCSPKGGQASGAFTQINNMKTRGTESSPIADDEYCEMPYDEGKMLRYDRSKNE